MGDLINLDAWRQSLADSMTLLVARVGEMLPALAGALLVLLVGWGVSSLAAAILRGALRRFGFDRASEHLRITETLQRARVSAAPSAMVARLFWWFLMLTFLLSAVEVLGLSAVTATIDRVIGYLPKVAAAALIIVAGMLLGRIVQNLVRSAGSVAGLAQSTQLGALCHAIVILVTGVVALEQLGVATSILVTVVTVLVATLGLTFGATFALGARPLVTHILAGHSLRQILPLGKAVEIGGRSGVVDHVGSVTTLLRDGDRSWSISNGALLDEIIVQ